MRTADFKKHQNATNLRKINLNANFSSKQSSSKTPKFLLSPRTNSLANSAFPNSLTAQDEQNYAQQSKPQNNHKKHRAMLDSQTSDEIYKVVHDFH